MPWRRGCEPRCSWASGSYTTFSTRTLESWRLLEDGAVGLALASLGGSLVAGLAAAYAGIVVGRAVT